jgi:hypothetical protein
MFGGVPPMVTVRRMRRIALRIPCYAQALGDHPGHPCDACVALRYAFPATRKPWVTILVTRATHASHPLTVARSA